VGGITLTETNALEFEFLNLIRYKLFVKTELYDKYLNYLRNYHLKK
jgi:hypothetical protein